MFSSDISVKKAAMVGFLTAGLVLALGASVQAQSPVTPPGAGNEADPYLISELGHLVWMGDTAADSAGKYYTMTADIDASETANWNDEGTDTDVLEGFKPIGALYTPFAGIFDGDGHTITGMVITERAWPNDCGGLFSYVGMGGQVKNLGMMGGIVTGKSGAVGSLIGSNYGGIVSNCYATGAVTGSDIFVVGGLIGINAGPMLNCHAAGEVTGDGGYVGGLIGFNNGDIINCYAISVVRGNSPFHGTGGLIGRNWQRVSDCYATGPVSGHENVGGLVGYNECGLVSNCYATGAVSGTYDVGGIIGISDGYISNCYATGAVTGDHEVGGLVGLNYYGDVSDSYWDVETSGQSTSAGGGEGKTTAEMMQQATFVDWDFVDIWGIDENETYPYLQSLPHDSDGDGIPDEEDDCPESDFSETIIINGYDTGVMNKALGDGCTMADEIASLAETSANHGDFVRQVAHLTNAWKRDGLISGAEKGRIQSAAAR